MITDTKVLPIYTDFDALRDALKAYYYDSLESRPGKRKEQKWIKEPAESNPLFKFASTKR